MCRALNRLATDCRLQLQDGYFCDAAWLLGAHSVSLIFLLRARNTEVFAGAQNCALLHGKETGRSCIVPRNRREQPTDRGKFLRIAAGDIADSETVAFQEYFLLRHIKIYSIGH